MIVARHVLGLAQREIAELLGVAPGTVAATVHQATALLRERLLGRNEVTDIDMDLKRVFDERLRGVTLPHAPGTARADALKSWPQRRSRQSLFAGVGLAMDVNSVAATSGLD